MPVNATSTAEVQAHYFSQLRAILEPRARAELRERRPALAADADRLRRAADSATAECVPLRAKIDALTARRDASAAPVPLPDITQCSDAEFDLAWVCEDLRARRLPALDAALSQAQNALTPLVQNERRAAAAARAADLELSAWDAAIDDPLNSAAGLETAAGRDWIRCLAGAGAPLPAPPPAPGPDDPRIRTRADGRKLALIVPGEISAEAAAGLPSAHPAWGTTKAPAGDVADPGRTGGFDVRPGIIGAGGE
jgi:hypothetical protein